MDINNLTIGQAKELAAMFGGANGHPNRPKARLDLHRKHRHCPHLFCCVWCGTLVQKSGNEVVLVNARRMWSWWCKDSISLSAVVQYGIDRSSKIAAAVDSVWLEAIEIMLIDGESETSIMEADIVQAE